MYIKRHISTALLQRRQWVGATVVTGARQVGKTTLMENTFPHINKISLDDKIILAMAKNDSANFINYVGAPVFIDEVQYAPEIFPYIKMSLDNSKLKGQYFLTGSQPFHLMENVSESLAGRAGILDMYGLSLREITNEEWTEPFLPSTQYWENRKISQREMDIQEIWNIIWRGFYPELYEKPAYPWDMFYGDYLSTYIERDVRQLAHVGNELQFSQFLGLMAARTGQILNLAAVAKDVGISAPTAKRWLSILKTSGLVYLLPPYHNNLGKRIRKAPKLYFTDTGLAAYLAGWNSPKSLMMGASSGAFFETFVVNEIIKSYANAGKTATLYYFRDTNNVEIDLLLFENNTLYPIEIKAGGEPEKRMIRAFDLLDGLPDIKRGEGGIICPCRHLMPLSATDRTIPVWLI